MVVKSWLHTTAVVLAATAVGCSSSGNTGTSFVLPFSKKTTDMTLGSTPTRHNNYGLPKTEEPSALEKMGEAVSSSPVGKTFTAAFRKSSDNTNSTAATAAKPDSKQKPSANFYVSVARLQERSGNLDGARQQYEKALETDPNDLPALLGLARLHDSQAEHAKAEPLYRKAMAKHPNDPAPVVGLARMYDKQGDLEKATGLYQKVVEDHPTNAAALNDLGLCFARRRMLRESRDALERAVNLQPQKALYRNNLATVLVELDQVDEAIRHLAAVHGPAVAHYNVGYLLHGRGRESAALAQFQAAARLDPTFRAAHDWVEQLGGTVAEPAPNRLTDRDAANPPPSSNVIPSHRRIPQVAPARSPAINTTGPSLTAPQAANEPGRFEAATPSQPAPAGRFSSSPSQERVPRQTVPPPLPDEIGTYRRPGGSDEVVIPDLTPLPSVEPQIFPPSRF